MEGSKLAGVAREEFLSADAARRGRVLAERWGDVPASEIGNARPSLVPGDRVQRDVDGVGRGDAGTVEVMKPDDYDTISGEFIRIQWDSGRVTVQPDDNLLLVRPGTDSAEGEAAAARQAQLGADLVRREQAIAERWGDVPASEIGNELPDHVPGDRVRRFLDGVATGDAGTVEVMKPDDYDTISGEFIRIQWDSGRVTVQPSDGVLRVATDASELAQQDVSAARDLRAATFPAAASKMPTRGVPGRPGVGGTHVSRQANETREELQA